MTEDVEPDLTDEVTAFLRERAALKEQYGSKWAVYKDQKLQGAFAEFETAADFAVKKFRDGAFLIRQITAEDERVPLIFAEAV